MLPFSQRRVSLATSPGIQSSSTQSVCHPGLRSDCRRFARKCAISHAPAVKPRVTGAPSTMSTPTTKTSSAILHGGVSVSGWVLPLLRQETNLNVLNRRCDPRTVSNLPISSMWPFSNGCVSMGNAVRGESRPGRSESLHERPTRWQRQRWRHTKQSTPRSRI